MATDAATTNEPKGPVGPDVLRIEPEDLASRPFPARESEYRVILESDAHQAILAHARSAADIELCGVLVGDLYRDDDGPYLVITDIIAGRAAKQGDTSVTFTHSTWEQIHREMDAKYAGRRIVGWYHTHPGFGVFLSEVDLFAHKNFFNAAWQVALVVDPKGDQIGLFFWKDGAIVRARRFWVGDEPRWDSERPAVSAAPGKVTRGRAEATTPTHREEATEEDGRFLTNTLLLSVLGILILVLGYLNIMRDLQNAQLASEVFSLRRQLGSESAALARSLAFRLRDRLDRGELPTLRLQAAFEEVARLDPTNATAYARLLPELAPPPEEKAREPGGLSEKAKRR